MNVRKPAKATSQKKKKEGMHTLPLPSPPQHVEQLLLFREKIKICATAQGPSGPPPTSLQHLLSCWTARHLIPQEQTCQLPQGGARACSPHGHTAFTRSDPPPEPGDPLGGRARRMEVETRRPARTWAHTAGSHGLPGQPRGSTVSQAALDKVYLITRALRDLAYLTRASKLNVVSVIGN